MSTTVPVGNKPPRWPPESDEDLRAMYSYLYAQKKIPEMPPYGASSAGRDAEYLNFIPKTIRPPARILDASCGRGVLARKFRKKGYEVEVTELVESLVRSARADGIPAHLLTYDELSRLPERSFDVVISNDVLEHLLDEQAARKAILDLARLSRGWLCFSVGWNGPQRKYLRQVGVVNGIHTGGLHLLRLKGEWWEERTREVMDLAPEFPKQIGISIYLFGRVKA